MRRHICGVPREFCTGSLATVDKEAVGTLFTVLGPRYTARPGGYLRILKCGFRAGDNAPMAYVELVDRPESATAVDAD